MKILQIVGGRKVGKTTFVTRLLPLIIERGLRVASVKHTRNPYRLDRPDADSDLHRRAGAVETLVLTSTEGALYFTPPTAEAELERLLPRFFADVDLVVIEGWRDRRGPRIEVLGPDAQGAIAPLPGALSGEHLAYVLGPKIAPPEVDRARGLAPGVPIVSWNETAAVCDRVTAWLGG